MLRMQGGKLHKGILIQFYQRRSLQTILELNKKGISHALQMENIIHYILCQKYKCNAHNATHRHNGNFTDVHNFGRVNTRTVDDTLG
jgi:hypothetical protein